MDPTHKDLVLRDRVTDRFLCRTVGQLDYLGYDAVAKLVGKNAQQVREINFEPDRDALVQVEPHRHTGLEHVTAMLPTHADEVGYRCERTDRVRRGNGRGCPLHAFAGTIPTM